MSARTDRLVFGVAARARGRGLEPGVKSHLCVDCRERRARFRYRGVVKAAADLVIDGHSELVDARALGLDRFDDEGRSSLAADPIALPFPVTAD